MKYEHQCIYCGTIPHSQVDKNFMKLFPKCWECFKTDWEEGKITTEEFEKMEETALNETMN